LGALGLAWPWLLSAGAFLFTAAYCARFPEDYRRTHLSASAKTRFCLPWQACGHGLKNPALIYAMAFGAVLSLALQALNMQWTKFFHDQYQLNVKNLAWVMVGVALAKASAGPLSRLANYLTGNEKTSLVMTQALTALAIITAAQASGLALAFGAFFCHEVGREIFSPLKQNYLNNHIKTTHRATLLSLDSMLMKIGSFLGLLLSGWLATAYSIRLAWLISGSLLLLAALLFLFFKKKSDPTKNGLS
jgi:predicted MFS family arabinose efflux permease